MSVLVFLVTGKAELDLRPVKGATMLAWGALALFTAVATAVADEIIEEAISLVLLLLLLLLVCKLLLSLNRSLCGTRWYI